MKPRLHAIGRLCGALLSVVILPTETFIAASHAEERARRGPPAGLAAPAPAPRAGGVAESATTPSRPVATGCIGALQAVAGHRLRAAEEAATAGRDAACRVVEPVVVEALAVRGPEGPLSVAFNPPVTLSCGMAKAVASWLDTSLQPLARGYFGRDLAGLEVGGGHECRRRNRATAGPLSEHATGQALDIFGFTFAGDGAAAGLRVEKPAGLRQNRFLEAARQSACGAFATSIGPGADAAHANHLHLDIQERRSAATRFCQ